MVLIARRFCEKFLRGSAIIDEREPRFINQVHRDDIAAALVRLVECRHEWESRKGAGARKIFNVVDDEPILQSDCYKWLAAKLGRPTPPIGKINWASQTRRQQQAGEQ